MRERRFPRTAWKRREARLNAYLADEAQKSIQPKTDMRDKCDYCGIKFEPKTPKLPIVGGALHYGCHARFLKQVEEYE